MTVTLVSTEAGFNNLLGMESPVDLNVFHCKEVYPGFPVGVGTLPAGELELRLTTPEGSPHTYYTGPGSRNPDGVVHAHLDSLSPSAVGVSWEDQYGGGDEDFNDCVVDVIVAPPGGPTVGTSVGTSVGSAMVAYLLDLIDAPSSAFL